MAHCCFKKGCDFYVEYVCLCLASETYCCEFHLREHLKLPNRTHVFDSILEEPCDWSKDGILSFLEREKYKKEQLKKIILASFTENTRNSESRLKRSLKYLDSDLKQINSLIRKVSNTSEILSNPSNFQLDMDAKKAKLILSKGSEPYKSVWLFYIFRKLRQKQSEILNRVITDSETEENFKKTCSLYQNYASDPLISQSLQEFKSDYQKMTSLYIIIINGFNGQTNLFIYDAASEKEEVKIIKTPTYFQHSACISQLPNGELFVLSEVGWPTICFIIDRNYKFRQLPSGWPWKSSLVIYFNRSVYCFGGIDNCDEHRNTSVSSRFDLNENRWIRLAPMPKRNGSQSCVIFNENILISGYVNDCIYLYSIDIDSYSEIFIGASIRVKKLLIKAEERLYLIEIENYGSIYESQAGDQYSWEWIARSMIDPNIDQVCGLYFKGEIYIATVDAKNTREYFKFDLSKNVFTDIAYYNERWAFKRSDGMPEVIKRPGHTFRIEAKNAVAYNKKKCTLLYLAECFERIEQCNVAIKCNPERAHDHMEKGETLYWMGRNLDAIECFNKAIKSDSKNETAYFYKGLALHDLGKHVEAIGCFSKAIKNSCGVLYTNEALFEKAAVLRDLGRNLEAIKCYNEVIKSEPRELRALIEKGDVLWSLNRNLEAVECYDLAINMEINPDALIKKGHALYKLGRYFEAMDCYSRAIEINPYDFQVLCYRANLFNEMGQEAEAMQDFNKAYEFAYTNINYGQYDAWFDGELIQENLQLIKMLSKLQKSSIDFKNELQKLKDACHSYPEVHKEVEEKEAMVKEKHSKLLKMTIESINLGNKSIETIWQIKNEIAELQKGKNDIATQLWLLLPAKQ